MTIPVTPFAPLVAAIPMGEPGPTAKATNAWFERHPVLGGLVIVVATVAILGLVVLAGH